jgi:tRNA A64-2'-O-ribosylphosphate transferase
LILPDGARVSLPPICPTKMLIALGMPDALSKTIPIWCSVINRFLFPEQSECHQLYTPPQVVSATEHAQIAALLPSFLSSFRDLGISTDDFKASITKPLRPIWITPDSSLSEKDAIFEDFHPIICCTVSRRVPGGELSGGEYIQGAGDDTENWAHGLTPALFWSNQEILLSSSEYDLPEVIETLLQSSTGAGVGNTGVVRCLKPTSCLFVAPLSAIEPNNMDTDTCVIALLPKVTQESTWKRSKMSLHVGLGPHKLGSRNLRMALPTIVDFASTILAKAESSQTKKDVIIACETGKDLSIGVALALLCLLFNENGALLTERGDKSNIDKAFIRHRLGWVSTSMPDANPNRATLQSVNSFLM